MLWVCGKILRYACNRGVIGGLCAKQKKRHRPDVAGGAVLCVGIQLLFAHENVDRSAAVVPVFANLVFKIALVRVFHPLRQVAEEHK